MWRVGYVTRTSCYSRYICSHSIMSCNKESSLVALIINPHTTGEEAQLPCHKVLTSLQSVVDQILTSGQFGPFGFSSQSRQWYPAEEWRALDQAETSHTILPYNLVSCSSNQYYFLPNWNDTWWSAFQIQKVCCYYQQHCVCPKASGLWVRNVMDWYSSYGVEICWWGLQQRPQWRDDSLSSSSLYFSLSRSQSLVVLSPVNTQDIWVLRAIFKCGCLVTPEHTKTNKCILLDFYQRFYFGSTFQNSLQSCQHVEFVTQWFLVAHEGHL